MPIFEIPEISSSSIEPEKFKAEIPTFEIPMFEMETESQESTFSYTPEPKVEPI